MDSIFIQQLSVDTTIGVYEWEKSIKQTLVFDLEMQWDSRRAASTDQLEYTVDYAQVSQFITDYVSNHQFELIETVANQIARLVIQEFKLSVLQLTLSKPGAVANAQNVGIKIRRTAADFS